MKRPESEAFTLPATCAQLADWLGARLVGDGHRLIRSFNDVKQAGPEEGTVLFDERGRQHLPETRAGLVITRGDWYDPRLAVTWLLVDDPVAALEKLYHGLYFPHLQGIHPTAMVDSAAQLGKGVVLGPWVYVGPDVVIGDGSWLGPRVVVMEGVRIGRDCRIFPGVVLYPGVRVGDRVVVHANAVLGSDGFRFVPDARVPRKIYHVGRVVIEDDVEIGAGTCIDRALLGTTRIGSGTKIDNLVQIGHNVDLGRACLLAAQVGIAGSVQVGDRVMMGGQVGIADHLTIGAGAVVAAKSGVASRIPENRTFAGNPAMERGLWLRAYAFLRDLPRWLQKFRRWDQYFRDLSRSPGEEKE